MSSPVNTSMGKMETFCPSGNYPTCSSGGTGLVELRKAGKLNQEGNMLAALQEKPGFVMELK